MGQWVKMGERERWTPWWNSELGIRDDFKLWTGPWNSEWMVLTNFLQKWVKSWEMNFNPLRCTLPSKVLIQFATGLSSSTSCLVMDALDWRRRWLLEKIANLSFWFVCLKTATRCHFGQNKWCEITPKLNSFSKPDRACTETILEVSRGSSSIGWAACVSYCKPPDTVFDSCSQKNNSGSVLAKWKLLGF